MNTTWMDVFISDCSERFRMVDDPAMVIVEFELPRICIQLCENFRYNRLVMPYKVSRRCPICQTANLKDLSAHLRQLHKLTMEERQGYLKQAKHSDVDTILRDNITENNYQTGLNIDQNISDLESEKSDENNDTQDTYRNELIVNQDNSDSESEEINNTEDRYRFALNANEYISDSESVENRGGERSDIFKRSQVNTKRFLPILRKMVSMPMERKRWFIKQEAPKDFIQFLREITANSGKFKLNDDHRWIINHSKTFRAIINKNIHPSRIHKFMTRKEFLQIFSVVLPQIIKIISK
jgi:hypothetical protein